MTSNWNTKISFDKKIVSTNAKRGVIKFDITDIAKDYAIDQSGELQRNGLLMKSDNNKYNILASNDSTLYHARTEITLK